MDTARNLALKDWSKRQPWNIRSYSTESESGSFGPSSTTRITRRNVAWEEDPFNYDRTKSPDPFELASQEENRTLLKDIKAKETEISALRRQIESMKRKTTMNLASPEYVFPEGLEYGNQYDEISDQDTSIIGMRWVYQDLDKLRAPELLDKLLKSKTISPLIDYYREGNLFKIACHIIV